MAFRLKLVPTKTNIDFFRIWKLTFGLTILLSLVSVGSFFVQGFNFGIDFRGGTTIRTESVNDPDLAAFREALGGIGLGDVTITEVFDPSFRADQHVTQVRIASSGEDAVVSTAEIETVEAAMAAIDPDIRFVAVESVGAKVSGELVQKAFIAVIVATLGIMVYIWLRFEWQFGVAMAVSLAHDALLTVGLWSVFQFKFDLTTVAAVLTIIGYSVNDTVVIFDRVRENLMKYKSMDLRDLLNLTINETLSRTVMTGITTILALCALFIWGGDVIRGFVGAMLFGVLVGVYSTIYVAVILVWKMGISRDFGKAKAEAAARPADGVMR